MTNDPGSDLRDRFRATRLPPAPVRLRERLAAVASTPIASTTPWFGRARLVMALAAAFAVASIGLLAGGGTDVPGPSSSPLTAEATAQPTAEATPDPTAEPLPFEVDCEEAEAPALTCAEVVQRVLELLKMEAAEWARIVSMEVSRPCDPPCLPTAHIVVTFVAGNLVDVQIGPGEAWQVMSTETFAPTEGPTEAPEP